MAHGDRLACEQLRFELFSGGDRRPSSKASCLSADDARPLSWDEKWIDPGGAVFRNLTRLSRASVPTVALVFGSSTAGGAYVPGMSDHTVMVRERAKVFLGGPPLVKVAIGEDADEEELGGAEMHARTSGLADHLAADERDCIRLGRQIVAGLNWRKLGPGPSRPADEPVHDPDELLGLAPVDVRVPADVREILARVLDGFAGVMSLLSRASAEAAGRPFDEEADRSMRQAVHQQVEAESTALFNTGLLYDDGILDPRDTRTALGIGLSACHSGEVAGTGSFGVFRM
jgi:acetyl-CoA carboxylase carboxyltransferase component